MRQRVARAARAFTTGSAVLCSRSTSENPRHDPLSVSLPTWFVHRPDVSAASKGLLAVIISFTNRRRECRPSRAQLLKASGMAKDTLEKHIMTLRRLGLLNTSQIRDAQGAVKTMFIPFPPEPDFGKDATPKILPTYVAPKTGVRKRAIYSRTRAKSNGTSSIAEL